MKARTLILVLLLSSFLSFNAAASMLTFETRGLVSDPRGLGVDYKTSWHAQGTPVTSTELTEFTNVQSGDNSFSRLAVNFDFGLRDIFSIRLGLDAGLGVAAYLDDVLLGADTRDRWWAYNWGRADTLSGLKGTAHKLEVYWAEWCCNGGQSAQLSLDGGKNWQTLSVANLDDARIAATPVPAAIWLFGTALIGLIGINKRKNAA